mmetsp:Transcript_26823/g.62842  ORF Transcript_26823/g.62842 Transcript_26823/m.62842 type:complete len:1177 (-) Transcript_26823:70-3600(-)
MFANTAPTKFPTAAYYVLFWLAVGAATAALCFQRALSDKKTRDWLKSTCVAQAIQALRKKWASRPAGENGTAGKKTWLLVDNIENGERKTRGGVVVERAAMEAATGPESLEVATLAALLTMLQRRRYNAVALGYRGLSGALRMVEVEIEPGLTFKSLVATVTGLLASGENSTEAPEVTLSFGASGEKRDMGEAGEWFASIEGPNLVIKGPTVEEEESLKSCFEAFAKDPNQNLFEVSFVPRSAAEAVKRWGSATKSFSDLRETQGLRCVHEIVYERHRNGTAVAVQGAGFKISYAELHQRAAAVCRAVREHRGAALMCMGRGEAIGPTFLGVLQSGSPMVPVDVAWPQERIKQSSLDADVGVALVEPSSLALLPELPCPTLVVDGAFYAKYAAEPDLCKAHEGDTALMLFTSGSTGKPKGIVLSHGYVTTLVAGITESKSMSPATKTLCYHSPTWMPFLDNLFGPLVSGGTCLFFPESEKHIVLPSELNQFAKEHGATHGGFVPAVLDLFAEEGLPPSLSHVGVGGAAVPSELCERVVPMLPQASGGAPGILYTGYSGTEQGDVTQLQMKSLQDVEAGTHESGFVTAGHPHASQTMAILDQGLMRVGVGAIGEITVAGPGLASGYLNLPEKTAEAFLPACQALDGRRAVRTGDLAHWTNTGKLKLVGRRDSMVKVRGARIELGEVEGTLAAHPAVKFAVVTVHEDKLVAYIHPAVPANLRDFCKEHLVSYMVPHIFQGLEEVPRLPTGKVNKKGLPKPEARADGAEVVMELDSLGQMRKFTRKAASEDKVLDNVRAILIGIVLHSHAIPLNPMKPSEMIDGEFQPLASHQWGPRELLLLQVVRSGGWSSLAFLSGFDDTRAMSPYGLTYREPLFLILWLLLDFNWTMWYLPVFVYMRAAFCAMHHLGLEKLHLLLASQIWIIAPAFIDMYIGWREGPGSPQPYLDATCPSQCFCPWQAMPWAQTVAHYTAGWWVQPSSPTASSMVGHALIFIPCYWIGFYIGDKIFTVLTFIADDQNILRRLVVAGVAMGLYAMMYLGGQPIIQGFDDTCQSFWSMDGAFLWGQVGKNLLYYALNLSMSLLYVVVIAALVPCHLQYLAKVCFASLIVSGLIPQPLDTPSQIVVLRETVSENWVSVVELFWMFYVPFLFEFVVGAIVTTLLPIVINCGIAAWKRWHK